MADIATAPPLPHRAPSYGTNNARPPMVQAALQGNIEPQTVHGQPPAVAYTNIMDQQPLTTRKSTRQQFKDAVKRVTSNPNMPSASQITNLVPELISKATSYLPTENTPEAKARSLKRIQFLSTYLDTKYKVPFSSIRIGLDPLISAVPMVGDVISTALSCYVVYLCRRFEVPWWITLKMVFNVVLNATFGYVPFLGSAFDVAYKPNMRNLILLEEFLRKEAIDAGRDPTQIDNALRKSRSEVLSFTGGAVEDTPAAAENVTAASSSSSRGWFGMKKKEKRK